MNIRSLPKAELEALIERRTDCAQLVKASYALLLQSRSTKDDPQIAKHLIQAAVLLDADAAIAEIQDLWTKDEEGETQSEASEMTNEQTEATNE